MTIKTKLKVARARLLFRATMKYDRFADRVASAIYGVGIALEQRAIVANETCFLEENLETLLEVA